MQANNTAYYDAPLFTLYEELQKLAALINNACKLDSTESIIQISRQPSHLQISVNDLGKETCSQLHLMPLCPGSHTQTDVVVKEMCSSSPTMATTDISRVDTTTGLLTGKRPIADAERLGPIDPSLHFCRFDSLPQYLARQYQEKNTVKTLLVLDKSVESEGVRQSLHTHLEFVENSNNNSTLTVVEFKNGRKPKLASIFERSGWTSNKGKPPQCRYNDVQCLSVHSSKELMAILYRSDLAIVPTLCLAMDCANAGTPYRVYGNCEFTPLEQEHFHCRQQQNNVTDEHRHSLASRKALAQFKCNAMDAEALYNQTSDLYRHIVQWLEEQGFTVPEEVKNQLNANSSHSIIPANVASKSTRREHFNTAQAKFRKFKNSPRQFLQDSKHTSLRQLGHWNL